jgi:putative hydrolase of the HAD superfamily
MKRQRPRAVLFDLGNTLVSYYKPADFGPLLTQIIDDLLRYLAWQGRSYAADTVMAEAMALNAERADLSIHPLEKRLQRIFGLDDAFLQQHRSELSRLFLAPIFATAKLNPAAVPLLAELKARGIITGIISNTPWGSPAADWHEELGRHGLRGAVDSAVFCVECGKRKPDPLIFRFALERIGVAAEDAVFVGDDARWDVFGAQSAGMRAVLLEPAEVEVAEGVERIHRLDELLPLLERVS